MTNKKMWFIYKTGHHVGPYSAHDIFQMYYRQEISDESLVWREGMEKWIILKDCYDLQDILIPDRKKFPEIFDAGSLANQALKELSPYADHLTRSQENVLIQSLPEHLRPKKTYRNLYDRRSSSQSSQFYKWAAPVLIFAMICVIMIPVLFFRDSEEGIRIPSSEELFLLEKGDALSFLQELPSSDYKRLSDTAKARSRDGAKIALYASIEKQKIWLSSNISQRATLTATFTSVNGKALSKTPIVLKTYASLDQHFAFFDKLETKIVPGLYDVNIVGEFLGDDDLSFKDKLIRFAESLIPSKADSFKSFFYKGRAFFADATVSDFALALKEFHEDKAALYEDLLERYKVLDSLLEKVTSLYEEKFKTIKYSREIASFEEDYSSELSHVFQELVIDAEKKKHDSKMGKDYEKLSSLGKEIGKLVALIIEKTGQSSKSSVQMSEKVKKDLLKEFRTRSRSMEKDLDQEMKTVQRKIATLIKEK